MGHVQENLRGLPPNAHTPAEGCGHLFVDSGNVGFGAFVEVAIGLSGQFGQDIFIGVAINDKLQEPRNRLALGQPITASNNGCLGAILGLQFAQDIRDVSFDGSFGDN